MSTPKERTQELLLGAANRIDELERQNADLLLALQEIADMAPDADEMTLAHEMTQVASDAVAGTYLPLQVCPQCFHIFEPLRPTATSAVAQPVDAQAPAVNALWKAADKTEKSGALHLWSRNLDGEFFDADVRLVRWPPTERNAKCFQTGYLLPLANTLAHASTATITPSQPVDAREWSPRERGTACNSCHTVADCWAKRVCNNHGYDLKEQQP